VPQGRKEVGSALDLVEDDQAPAAVQCEFRVREPSQVGASLEVEDCRRAWLIGCESPCEGRLADLAGTENGNHGISREQPLQVPEFVVAVDHCRENTMKIGGMASKFHGMWPVGDGDG
jgi:hypothetical protein